MSYDQRAVLPDSVELIGMLLKNDTESIRTFHPVHDLRHCFQWISLVIIIQKVCDHLRICLRYKLVSSALQLLFQLDVVLDNSIVDDYNRLFGVQMRMGVRIRWGTMCRPPGMPDSKCTRQQDAIVCELAKCLQTPFRLCHIDLLSVKNRNPGRIIASVLQL